MAKQYAVQCCVSKQEVLVDAPDEMIALEKAKRLQRVHVDTKLHHVRCLEQTQGPSVHSSSPNASTKLPTT